MTSAAPHPLCFGEERAELFGWLHPADGPSPLVLVICSPVGNEEVFAHRGLRHLAQASAAAGIPALRFDYHGIGDSAGEELAPGRLSAWVSSIHQAVDAAKRHTGASRVALLGVRFGATLATLAAMDRGDVAGLVSVAGVVRGRAHARELKLLNLASDGVAGDPPASAALDSPNFVLSHETMETIARTDLSRPGRAPATRMLLIDRDDLPGDGATAQYFRELGADVCTANVEGYAALMDMQVPGALIARCVDWLKDVASRLPPELAGGAQPVAASTSLQPNDDVREIPLKIRAGGGLAAMLSMPAHPVAAPPPDDRRAILLLAAGVGRYIGQGRLYVELARELAAAGHVVMRLDLSGIGNSAADEQGAENCIYAPTAERDVLAAMHELCAWAGTSVCQVVGHCSGAFHAFRSALAGGPASVVLQIDPGILSIADKHRSEFREAIAENRGKFMPLLDRQQAGTARQRVVLVQRLRRRVSRAIDKTAGRLPWLGLSRYSRELLSLASRGVQMHFVFCGSGKRQQMLEEQASAVVRTLVGRGAMTLSTIAGADHIFSRWEHRQQLRRLVVHLLRHGATASQLHPSGRPVAAAGGEPGEAAQAESPAAARINDQACAERSFSANS